MSRIIRASLALLIFALLARVFLEADLGRVSEILLSCGPAAALAFLPYLVGLSIDTTGWRVVLARLGHRLRFTQLLSIRLVSEAVLLTAPAGPVAAEAL